MPVAKRPFLSRYLQGELADFFELAPGDLEGALAVDRASPRNPLADSLSEEARRLDAPPQVLGSIERLRQANSRVVVTGQQSGLLLGPAYTLSKAMSAISLARELDSEERPVLAVFWVASQDHDTDEVDHANLLDGDEHLHRLELPLPKGVATGHLPFQPEWLDELLAGLERAGGRREHREEIAQLLKETALPGSYADFFGRLLYRLLGDQGLIVLDPSRPGVAELSRELLDRELRDPHASVEAIQEAGERLRALHLEPQLGRGQGATNLFLEEPEGDLSRRRLLRFDGKRYSTGEREYTPDELQSLLCDEPWRVTPAAGLRPILQDSLLPTAAFVVGPGELRYIAQLRDVYRHHGVAMPLIWPRATSVVLEPPVVRILARYGLSYAEYAAAPEEVMHRVLLERHGCAEEFESALGELERTNRQLMESISGIDPTLQGTVERTRSRVEQATTLLREKTALALADRDEITRRQFERLAVQLFPAGVPQERFLSPFSFFLKFGVEPTLRAYRTVGSSGEHLLRP